MRAKNALVKATESVRNKFQQIRSTHLENNRLLEEQYKPITKRLGKLIDAKSEKTTPLAQQTDAQSKKNSPLAQQADLAPKQSQNFPTILPWHLELFTDSSMDHESDDDDEIDSADMPPAHRKRLASVDQMSSEAVPSKKYAVTPARSSSSALRKALSNIEETKRKKHRIQAVRRILEQENAMKNEREKSTRDIPMPFIDIQKAKSKMADDDAENVSKPTKSTRDMHMPFIDIQKTKSKRDDDDKERGNTQTARSFKNTI